MDPLQRILVVEDSPTQAIQLCHILQQEGWEAVWTPSVPKAMEEIARQIPDLVLLDFYLPGIPSEEFCRHIRRNIDKRHIPILMMTAEDTPETQRHGLESGADEFVPKSVGSEVLLARIRGLLSKARRPLSVLGEADWYFQRARLLTIDDSQTYLEYLANHLGREGYRVERAVSGQEGLDRIGRSPLTACSWTWSCRGSMASRSAAVSTRPASTGRTPWRSSC